MPLARRLTPEQINVNWNGIPVYDLVDTELPAEYVAFRGISMQVEWIYEAAQDPERAAAVIVTKPGEALRILPPPDPEARPAVSLARFENLDDDDLED